MREPREPRLAEVPVVRRSRLQGQPVTSDLRFSIARQDSLEEDLSRKIFQRTGEITQVEVNIPDSQIRFA